MRRYSAQRWWWWRVSSASARRYNAAFSSCASANGAASRISVSADAGLVGYVVIGWRRSAQRRVNDFPGLIARDLFNIQDLKTGRVQAGAFHHKLLDGGMVVAGGGVDAYMVVLARAHASITAFADQLFQLVQIDAVAKQFQEALLAAHHIVVAVRVAPCQVAGAQHAAVLVALEQIGVAGRVAHGDILAAIDQLAGGLMLAHGLAGGILEPEGAARNRHADTAGLAQRLFAGQIGHARGRLGLSVHGEVTHAFVPAQLGDLARQVRAQAPASLGQ